MFLQSSYLLFKQYACENNTETQPAQQRNVANSHEHKRAHFLLSLMIDNYFLFSLPKEVYRVYDHFERQADKILLVRPFGKLFSRARKLLTLTNYKTVAVCFFFKFLLESKIAESSGKSNHTLPWALGFSFFFSLRLRVLTSMTLKKSLTCLI